MITDTAYDNCRCVDVATSCIHGTILSPQHQHHQPLSFGNLSRLSPMISMLLISCESYSFFDVKSGKITHDTTLFTSRMSFPQQSTMETNFERSNIDRLLYKSMLDKKKINVMLICKGHEYCS